MNSMKRKTKNILACSLAILTAATTVTPVFAVENSIGSSTADAGGGQLTGRDPNYEPEKNSEYKEANEGTHAADVYVSQGSTYTVTLPKTVILDGKTAESNNGIYKVSVDGDISGDEIINVTPKSNNKHINSSHAGDTTTENGITTCANITDENVQFYLGQKNKDDILANVNQNKTAFTTADLQSKDSETPTNVTTGEVSTNNISAGSWKGNFSFNVDINSITQWYDITNQLDLANGENARWNMFGKLSPGDTKNEYRTMNIPVKAGEIYRISGVVYGSDRLLIAKSELGDGSQYIVNDAMIPEASASGSGAIKEQILTIPEGANWLCVSTAKFALSQFKLEKLGDNTINFANYTNENFKWSFDKPYVTITIDDTNDNINEIADVFAKHNMPCNYATQYSRINGTANNGKTKKDILLKAQESGSEILAHHYLVLDDKSTENDYTEIYENTKTNLENAGFVVNGIIVSGGATYHTQNFAKSTTHAYNAGYLYSDLTATNNIYNKRYYNPRTWNETGDINYWQTQIDNLISKGSGWLNIASHVDADWNSEHTMNVDMLDKILTYCEKKGVEVITWNNLYNTCAINK